MDSILDLSRCLSSMMGRAVNAESIVARHPVAFLRAARLSVHEEEVSQSAVAGPNFRQAGHSVVVLRCASPRDGACDGGKLCQMTAWVQG